jgi:hypothetical protein
MPISCHENSPQSNVQKQPWSVGTNSYQTEESFKRKIAQESEARRQDFIAWREAMIKLNKMKHKAELVHIKTDTSKYIQ